MTVDTDPLRPLEAPEDARIIEGVIALIFYTDEAGTRRYRITSRGGLAIDHVLGTIELAKLRLIQQQFPNGA